MTERWPLPAGLVGALRALIAAALISVLGAAALWAAEAGEHSSGPPAGHALASASAVAHGLPRRARRTTHRGLESLPQAAQGPVSSTLGETDPAYRIIASSGGLRALSPRQHLRIAFSRSGVRIDTGKARLGLRLRAFGYGSALHALGAVRPQAKGNRVTYRRSGLTEWYANGPLGVEQGFTVAKAPSGGAGPLTLAMAISGNARASVAAGAESLVLRGPGAALRYGELLATDARGHTLRSWLVLDGGSVLLRVDTRGARYPLRIDPFIANKLTATGESGAGGFGTSVAVSADGSTALIGSTTEAGNTGSAWVFVRSGAVWTQQGSRLTGSGESGAGAFGASVALSGDGNTALIGGPEDAASRGAVWVFARSGSSWSQLGEKLTGGGETGPGSFGRSIALSADGKTALIGGLEDNGFAGAAWVFTRSGAGFTQQGAKLTGGAEESERGEFGYSVALSADGSTALIGAAADHFSGAAWVFTRSGTTWTQQGAKLTSGSGPALEGEPFGAFGYSVALSSAGSTALIGGPGEAAQKGAAWIFTRSGSTWTRSDSKLTGGGPRPQDAESGAGFFGLSVALSGNGDEALVGAPEDGGGAGAMWVFTRSHSAWLGEKLVGNCTSSCIGSAGMGEIGNGNFGTDVAFSSDGSTALAGAPKDNNDVGAAWAFVNPNPTSGGRAGSGTSSAAAGPPVLTEVSQSNRRWREGKLLPQVTHRPKRRQKTEPHNKSKRHRPISLHEPKLAPLGTTFSFELNEQASVSFAFTQLVRGRTTGNACAPETTQNKHDRECALRVTRDTLSFTGHAGLNKVSFQGRITRSRSLKPGDYTVLITATNANGESAPKQLGFTIVA